VAQRKVKASEANIGRAAAMTLEIVRIFNAPRALVYAMWSTPAHLGKWSAPKGFTIPEARTDFRQGGSWYAHMRSPDGEDHRVQGKYLEIAENARIVMTHAWLDGACNPGPETVVTVTFEDHGKKTKMTFLQEGFTSAASRDGHEGGWNQCFDLLDAHLAGIVSEQGSGASADQDIVITRLIDAQRELVFEAFKDPLHISQWWGPNGFTTTTYEMDVRPGGQWLFTMHGSDGTDYPNRIRYTEVRVPEFIAYDHDGGDDDDGTHAFKATVQIATEGRKTRVTLRLVFATKEQREAMAKFGAIEGGNQTLGRLESYLTKV
jgi:uncharacterized protein YndB with AHSA1/START domain